MRIRYDARADAAHVSPAETIADGEADAPGLTGLVPPGHGRIGEINLDFDREGRLLGIEILGAGRLLRPEMLESAEIVPGP